MESHGLQRGAKRIRFPNCSYLRVNYWDPGRKGWYWSLTWGNQIHLESSPRCSGRFYVFHLIRHPKKIHLKFLFLTPKNEILQTTNSISQSASKHFCGCFLKSQLSLVLNCNHPPQPSIHFLRPQPSGHPAIRGRQVGLSLQDTESGELKGPEGLRVVSLEGSSQERRKWFITMVTY